MQIDLYQVDAFTSAVFSGNPAAVCPLDHWLADETLRAIADENNLSETAFFVAIDGGYHLRWFTPEAEVDLCGHATLAAAHVIFTHLGYSEQVIHFETNSGELLVSRSENGYTMDFPASSPEGIEAPEILLSALGIASAKVMAAYDYVVVINTEAELRKLSPDFAALIDLDLRGVVVTAPGEDVDFVSRCFFPKLRVNEDPVTGSAHCELAPYWARRLGRNSLTAKQLSRRGGTIQCEVTDDRVILSGRAVDYLKGQISI